MPVTIERLRWWLVAGAVMLLLVIGSFLGYARYRARRLLTELPALLGADIQQSTNGFTYSQSIKGKTLFTLHAAKEVQRKDGKISLHDVGIVLYGTGAKEGRGVQGARADRITGSDFEYDKESGVVRALGEVHMDLQGPSQEMNVHDKPAAAAVAPSKEKIEGDMIHVKTSGLVFLQKLGVAATDEHIEFQYKDLQGEAQGAEYDADTGILRLRKDVHMTAMQNGRLTALTATEGSIDRNQHQTDLKDPRIVSQGEIVQAITAHISMQNDGSPQQLAMDGNVSIQSSTRGDVNAPHAVLNLSKTNHIEAMHLFGGVLYKQKTANRKAGGNAQEARIAFDEAGHARTVNLNGKVHLQVNENLADERAEAGETVRELVADKVQMLLGTMGDSKLALSEARAQGGALVTVRSPVRLKTGAVQMEQTSMSADTLVAHGAGGGAGKSAMPISRVEGQGHTVIESSGGAGGIRKSSGDTLEIRLQGAAKKHAGGASGGMNTVESAVQSGHVVMVQTDAPTTKKPANVAPTQKGVNAVESSRAVADRAEYNAMLQEVVLTGAPVVEQAGARIEAERIRIMRESGDAFAEGQVKATYLSAGGGSNAEAMHVIADRARLLRAAGTAIFTGGARPARLWQGASQVEAPVLEMEQAKQRLLAHSAAGSTASDAVHVVMAGAPKGGKPGTSKDAKSPVGKNPGAVRIRSRELVYADRRAQFAGNVEVESADGIIRADHADAFMREKNQPDAALATVKNAAAGIGGGVESVVAEGNVRIEQPGRIGTGEKLTYSAAKGEFELTGSPGAPPVVRDDQRGSTTGASLLFRSGDDSVIVAGAAGKPARTETKMQK